MNISVNTFKKELAEIGSERYNANIQDNESILDRKQISLEATDGYLQKFTAYGSRLGAEINEFNTALSHLSTNEKRYQNAIADMGCDTEEGYIEAAEIFSSLSTYRQSSEHLSYCRQRLDEINSEKEIQKRLTEEKERLAAEAERIANCEKQYQYALSLMEINEINSYSKAISLFGELQSYKNSEKCREVCIKRYNKLCNLERKNEKKIRSNNRHGNDFGNGKKKSGKIIKVLIIVALIIAALIGIILLFVNIIIPFIMQNILTILIVFALLLIIIYAIFHAR